MSKRLGQWLFGIGIASQVLPLLGTEGRMLVHSLLGPWHAQIGLLISVLGGFLAGFGSARTRPAPAKVAVAVIRNTANAHSSPPPPAKATPRQAVVAPRQRTAKPATDRLDKKPDFSRPVPKQATAGSHRDVAKPKSPKSSAPPSAPPKKRAAKIVDPGRVVGATHQDALETAPRQSASPLAKPASATRRPTLVKSETSREEAPLRIVLIDAGPHKIEVIRAIRDGTGLSLSEVVALVDGAPTTIKENASAREAGAIKARLEAMGATVELR